MRILPLVLVFGMACGDEASTDPAPKAPAGDAKPAGPPADGAGSPGDGAAAAGDGSLPPGDGSLPPGDGAQPAGDGALPAGDGAASAGDGAAAPADAPAVTPSCDTIDAFFVGKQTRVMLAVNPVEGNKRFALDVPEPGRVSVEIGWPAECPGCTMVLARDAFGQDVVEKLEAPGTSISFESAKDVYWLLGTGKKGSSVGTKIEMRNAEGKVLAPKRKDDEKVNPCEL